MDQLERCRTGELGHAWYRCDACGTVHAMPQSCGNRHSPLCQGHKAKQWLEQQLQKLLPCAYFLITFTLPRELHALARDQPGECYRAMFDAAAATLRELATNPKSKVRHYGFCHPRQQTDLEWLKMLVTVTLACGYVLLVAAKPLPVAPVVTCL
jgi:hypothetical protein